MHGGAAQRGFNLKQAFAFFQPTRLALSQDFAPLPGRRHEGLGQVRRQRRAANQHQAFALQAIDRTHIRVQLRAQRAHGFVGQRARFRIPAQAHRHRVLAFLQPQRIGGRTPGLDGLDHRQRHQQEADPTNGAVDE